MLSTQDRELLSQTSSSLIQYLEEPSEESRVGWSPARQLLPVIQLASPQELERAFAREGVPLSLLSPLSSVHRGQQPQWDPSQLHRAGALLRKFSARTGHPFFFNQLYSRVDAASLAGDWTVSALNTNAHTYEVCRAPIYRRMHSKD